MFEIERKYIIFKPDESVLSAQEGYSESKIEQVYISVGGGVCRRIRKRCGGGRTVCTETIKTTVSAVRSIEDEHEISLDEYEKLYRERDLSRSVINKTRRIFRYHGQLFELDYYPFWQKTCIMETELRTEDEKIEIPPFIKILEEVSEKIEYKNFSLAERIPPERTYD